MIKQWSRPALRRRNIPQSKCGGNEQIDSDESQTSSEAGTPKPILEDKDFLKRLGDVGRELWCMSPEELVRRRRLRCQSSAASITADNLLTLIYLNVFRGLTWNIHILGLDSEQMCIDEYPSPFLPCSPTATSAITKLPPGLRPTPLQLTVEHHPYIDIFPCPILRDNLLRYPFFGNEEEEQLCIDLMGLSEGVNEGDRPPEGENRIGATVWGDPWVIENWEVSRFLTVRWPWLLKGCFALEVATNRRRIARGWKAIRFA